MDDIYEQLTDDEDFVELIRIVENRRALKRYMQRRDHFNKWTEQEFRQRYRLSKDTLRFVIHEISDEIANNTARNHSVSAEDMVLLTLRFLATGSFLRVAGDMYGIHESTASRIVTKVLYAIARKHNEYIKLPMTLEETNAVRGGFFEIARFPRCIGALDCTHVKIQAPSVDGPEIIRCRKGYFYFNVQAIYDANLKFSNVVCRWPGSTHDATIFANSHVRALFENGVVQDNVLLGDSDYEIKSYLITPLLNPCSPEEHLFNESQIRTRNPIERCFGIWKRRFPILSTGIKLNYDKVESIVLATAVLHNIARQRNEPENPIDAVLQEHIEINVEVPPGAIRKNNVNNATRNNLIDYFQTSL